MSDSCLRESGIGRKCTCHRLGGALLGQTRCLMTLPGTCVTGEDEKQWDFDVASKDIHMMFTVYTHYMAKCVSCLYTLLRQTCGLGLRFRVRVITPYRIGLDLRFELTQIEELEWP